jgi:hypothetical protein
MSHSAIAVLSRPFRLLGYDQVLVVEGEKQRVKLSLKPVRMYSVNGSFSLAR